MCAILAEVAERNVVVMLSTVPGTAQGTLHVAVQRIQNYSNTDVFFSPTAPTDYTPIMAELTFPASTTTLCSNISVSGDSVLEVNEVFTVWLNTLDQAA